MHICNAYWKCSRTQKKVDLKKKRIKSLEKFPENNDSETTNNLKVFYTTKKVGTFERELPNKRQKCKENTSKMGEKNIYKILTEKIDIDALTDLVLFNENDK